MNISALIVDDEPLARQRLRDLIAPVDWVEASAEAGDCDSAVAAIETFRPDLVFLDIKLPGGTGLDVLRRSKFKPHVVFTTAYDRYAVTAFELQALDYLLKPFSEDRFQQAILRVRQAIQSKRDQTQIEERAGGAFETSQGLKRLFVRTRGRIVPISVDEIVRIEAQGDFVMIHTQNNTHLVYVSIKDLVSRLEAGRFVRVHRSHVVNLDCVASCEPYDGHRLLVKLQTGVEIVASKTGTKLLRQLVV